MRVAMSILSFLAVLTIADHLVADGYYSERTLALAAHMIRAMLN